MRYHLTPVRIAIVKYPTKNPNWRGYGEMRTLLHRCWNVNWEQPLWRQCGCMLSHFSRVQLFSTPWTVAYQAPLSMGFSRQEYWSGLPSPPPGDLPHSGIEPASLMFPALEGRFFATSTTWEVCPGSLNNENGNKIAIFLWD